MVVVRTKWESAAPQALSTKYAVSNVSLFLPCVQLSPFSEEGQKLWLESRGTQTLREPIRLKSA